MNQHVASTVLSDSEDFPSPQYFIGANAETLRLDKVLAEVQAAIAPLWPLQDFVAVNPFVGWTDRRFLAARQILRQLRDGDTLMPLDYYRKRVQDGVITARDLQLAWQQCRREYPLSYVDQTLEQSLSWLTQDRPPTDEATCERRYWTVAEAIDGKQDSDWATAVTGEISRHCAAHYDAGQATWPSPWKSLPLYEAWREMAMRDRRFEKLGVAGFRQFVSELPSSPQAAIERLLKQLGVANADWGDFLLCQLLSISGWASYVQYRVREATLAGREDAELIGLLAIRLAYDTALWSSGLGGEAMQLCPAACQRRRH